ncbi:MAG TPA: serine hydrolase domain-containing protein [Thermoanaerobaculia bacterium]|nr:serine hydrolase domain-containing protein [Thermoanaerobaculia bacterium]
MRAFLDLLLSTGTVASAVALTGTPEKVIWEGAVGDARLGLPATPETRFDFASLTKPFTFTLALVLDQDGTLPLSTRIGEVWSGANPRLGGRPLSDLLRHRSGLASWAPLYQLCRSREEVLPLLLDEPRMRPNRHAVYGDLDILLYGLAAESVTGHPYERLVRSRVLDPLGLSLFVEPAPGDQPDVALSPIDTDKEVELAAQQGLAIPLQGPPPPGLPQDGNARFLVRLDGPRALPAHAGLFGRACDLWRLGSEWLEPRVLLNPEATAAALRGNPFYLGWMRRDLKGSSGRALAPGSFGHTGFTGGSLWIDREQRRVLVLLAHRKDPSSDMNAWRRRFHALAGATYIV